MDRYRGGSQIRRLGASLSIALREVPAKPDKDIGIGGASLAAAAIKLGLVDELRMFRHLIIVGSSADVGSTLMLSRVFVRAL